MCLDVNFLPGVTNVCHARVHIWTRLKDAYIHDMLGRMRLPKCLRGDLFLRCSTTRVAALSWHFAGTCLATSGLTHNRSRPAACLTSGGWQNAQGVGSHTARQAAACCFSTRRRCSSELRAVSAGQCGFGEPLSCGTAGRAMRRVGPLLLTAV